MSRVRFLLRGMIFTQMKESGKYVFHSYMSDIMSINGNYSFKGAENYCGLTGGVK